MEEIALLESTVKPDSEYEVAIGHIIAEMNLLHEKMAEDQWEIERLRAETRANLDRMKTA